MKSKKWRDVNKEIKAIERHITWVLTTLREWVNNIRVKWIFKTKLNENVEIDKCRLDLWQRDMNNSMGLITQRYLLQLQD